ncbi:MAG: molybdopterin converting factor subunit 1 [Betaproteobacteria bacterium RIFCSPLOWO2_12_FULL_62_13b]|nr:MAG: molybdopterin converting factor subunit 1 [Betaproteobacteria bacterium RIFCSPLOWO2_12_FULL_62_13b]
MSIRILYFARLREDMGIAGEMFELPAEVSDVNSLRAQLVARGGASAVALASGKAVRVSVNQDLARGDTPVKAGDEVAFFPPVTGG